LAILCEVDRRIAIELGRKNPKWGQKNVCTPCLYKVNGEPPLKFKFLATMDGNNSMKLVDSTYRAGTVRTDSRTTQSPRWINLEEVNVFKDEVAKVRSILSFCYMIVMVSSIQSNSRTSRAGPSQSDQQSTTALGDLADLASEETAWLNVTEHNDFAKCLDTCVNRWRNAGPEARKRMFALFAIAGIFLAVCRHGHVLVICDMIRSGELYVYSSFSMIA
jgi:hypothetical protein